MLVLNHWQLSLFEGRQARSGLLYPAKITGAVTAGQSQSKLAAFYETKQPSSGETRHEWRTSMDGSWLGCPHVQLFAGAHFRHRGQGDPPARRGTLEIPFYEHSQRG